MPSISDYKAYLNSPEWAAKRTQALKHYGRRCSRCGSEKRLQVHHKNYASIGNEKMEDLEILCYGCHCAEHNRPMRAMGPSRHKVYWARRKLGIYGEVPWKKKH